MNEVTNDLTKEYHDFLKREWFDKPGKTTSEMMRLTAEYFANWQKQYTINKACEWLSDETEDFFLNRDERQEFLDNFRKEMEG